VQHVTPRRGFDPIAETLGAPPGSDTGLADDRRAPFCLLDGPERECRDPLQPLEAIRR
jgi:hypothetical protein